MPTQSLRLPLVVALLAIGTSCAGRLDRFTENRVLPAALRAPDLAKACAMGESLGHALAAIPDEDNPPHAALLVAEATSGVCEEETAWEAELASLRAKRRVAVLGTEEVRDARLLADRAHLAASARFHRAWDHLEAHFGPIGEGECPRIREREELSYLLGLISGILAVIHDRKGGGGGTVPVEIIAAAARGAECLDDEAWWYVPSAIQGGAWATIPGSGPAEVDPWALLAMAAATGEGSGVRIGRALQVFIAANAGRSDLVAEGIQAHAASLESTPQDGEWALFDEYARAVTLHESDLLWTEADGHRTPRLGELPGADEQDALPIEDPFADPGGTQ